MQCVIKCVAFPNVKISIGEEDTSELEKQIQYYFEKENFSKSKRVQFFKECFKRESYAIPCNEAQDFISSQKLAYERIKQNDLHK